MPLCGTFAYVAVVPDDVRDGLFECPAESHEEVPLTGDRFIDHRLVGLTPLLTVTEAGLTPEKARLDQITSSG